MLRPRKLERPKKSWQNNESLSIISLHAYLLSCFSCVLLFATLCTVVHQVLLSMRFSRQEHWGGLPCLPPGDLPNPGIKSMSPVVAGGFFTTSAIWEDLKGDAVAAWAGNFFSPCLLSAK